ncbi:MAG TPA: type II toxin-antitoxin system HicA family toxin [Candidatus Paceibacterota bacterium]
MPKRYSSDEIIKVLTKRGFVFVSQKGSHVKFKNFNQSLIVVVPANRREIPIGTFRSIVRQSRLNTTDFGC